MAWIDLRSDTVTRPSEGMREAMARAEVGDDVYGEDPTVRALEEEVARRLGKEAAVFVPTGTMANQIAIGAQAGMGDEVICEASSHVAAYEGGGIAALWGAQPRMLVGVRGILEASQIEEAIQQRGDPHLPLTRLICLENTHNRGGGSCWPAEALREAGAAAERLGIPIHLDGARLWNAAIATGVPLEELAAPARTVSVCLSKGLGAPAGSVVAGPRELEPTLRRLRKRLGGGMRQAGILAAAGSYALEHNLPLLEADHRKARLLGEALRAAPGLQVDPVETNLVFATLPEGRDANRLCQELKDRQVAIGAVSARRIRLVTHLDVSMEDCARAADLLLEALGRS